MKYRWHKLQLLTVTAFFGSLVIVGSSISHGESSPEPSAKPGVGITRGVGGSDLSETMPGYRNRTSAMVNLSVSVVGASGTSEKTHPLDFSVATGRNSRALNKRPHKTMIRIQTQPYTAVHVALPTDITARRTKKLGAEIEITGMKSNLPLGQGRASSQGKFIASIQGSLGRIDDKMPGGIYQGAMPVTVAYE